MKQRGKQLLKTGRYKAFKRGVRYLLAEFWTKRPFNRGGGGGEPGRFTKKRTAKAERREGKRECGR